MHSGKALLQYFSIQYYIKALYFHTRIFSVVGHTESLSEDVQQKVCRTNVVSLVLNFKLKSIIKCIKVQELLKEYHFMLASTKLLTKFC